MREERQLVARVKCASSQNTQFCSVIPPPVPNPAHEFQLKGRKKRRQVFALLPVFQKCFFSPRKPAIKRLNTPRPMKQRIVEVEVTGK